MILWIQKFFHTDKWWGKTILLFLLYFFYWVVFYGSWLIMPDEWFVEKNHSNSEFFGYLIALFLFFLIPILSFLIPHYIKKVFKINRFLLYTIHIFLILFSIFLFLGLGALMALSHMQIG